MTQPVPRILLDGNNTEVLQYLAPLSCHGDNTETLQACLAHYRDVYCFCPDVKAYRYFLWYTGNTVFAYGVGMSDVSLRFTDEDTALAAQQAREIRHFDGATWCSLGYDCKQLENLARLAYDHAKS